MPTTQTHSGCLMGSVSAQDRNVRTYAVELNRFIQGISSGIDIGEMKTTFVVPYIAITAK